MVCTGINNNTSSSTEASEPPHANRVGDMISVIDMPPPEESIWWKGKRSFEVGFFPCECVEVIGDKVPHGLNLSVQNSPENRKNSSSSSADEDDIDPGSPSEPTKPVLRKHGKLISFFRSFILSRPARGKLKKSGILKERVFGCDLSEHLLNSGQEIPKVLYHCAEFIENKGIIDGIYRLSGIASNIQKLRVAFDEDRVPDLYCDKGVLQDIHCVSSLLKMYFRELPNPICTYHLYEKFVHAAKSSENQRLVLLREVVQQLPPPNYRTLEYLSRHLYRVSLRGHETGMTAKNVAIVWAPNLLRCKSLEVGGVAALQGVGVQAVVTEYLIRYCELIFSDKMPLYSNEQKINSSSAGGAETPKKCRPKSLAISTPTKLLTLEEARSRALTGVTNFMTEQKYIEVGGGPAQLPQTYHTVIDLPAGRKPGGSMKQRKSPIGWKAIFSGGRNKSKSQIKISEPDLVDVINQSEDDDESNNVITLEPTTTTLKERSCSFRPIKSAESLIPSERSVTNEINKSPNSRFVSSKLDELAPLEAISQALGQREGGTSDSPKCHSRSSSHDSYFERQQAAAAAAAAAAGHLKHSVQFKMEEDKDPESPGDNGNDAITKSPSLDLSEIQVNFELEENEMKIFSEDEAMMSASVGSDLSRSPMMEEDDMKQQQHHRRLSKDNSEGNSPKGRKMSFREKFKRFTSPTPSRKQATGDSSNIADSEDCNSATSSTSSPKDQQQRHSIKENLMAPNPESLRRKSEIMDVPAEASPKKKKSNFTPGTSPNINLVKRSKIEEEDSTKKDKKEGTKYEEKSENEADDEFPTTTSSMPISPSIKFIDAPVTTTEVSSTVSIKTIVAATEVTTAPTTMTDTLENNRLSTTSSTDEEGSTNFVIDHLVIAQVHHGPILENLLEEEKEEVSLNKHSRPPEEQDDGEKEVTTAMTEKQSTPCVVENKVVGDEKSSSGSAEHFVEIETPTETSYSLAGATISENENFSLASLEEEIVNKSPPTSSSLTTNDKNPEESRKEITTAFIQSVVAMEIDEHSNIIFKDISPPSPSLPSTQVVEPEMMDYDDSVHSGLSQSATAIPAVDEKSSGSERSYKSSSEEQLMLPGTNIDYQPLKPAVNSSSNSSASSHEEEMMSPSGTNSFSGSEEAESKTKNSLCSKPPLPQILRSQTLESAIRSDYHRAPVPAARSIYSPPLQNFQSRSTTMEENIQKKPSSSPSSPPPRVPPPPVPTPRLSKLSPTSRECVSPTHSFEVKSKSLPPVINDLDGRISAQGIPEVEKRLKFAEPNLHRNKTLSEDPVVKVPKKMSTISLKENEVSSSSSSTEENLPLQRRNSIHNVPYVDVNDPGTRERMERYKEERRSLLRAKYKVEDYRTKKPSTTEKAKEITESEEEPFVPLRKLTVGMKSASPIGTDSSSSLLLSRKWSLPPTPTNDDNCKFRLESSTSPPLTLILSPVTSTNGLSQSFFPKSNANNQQQQQRITSYPPASLGLINEDVNVRERAAIFGNKEQQKQNIYNWKKVCNSLSSTAISSSTITNNNLVISNSKNKSTGSISVVKESPGSPSKIKNIAAFFEQKS